MILAPGGASRRMSRIKGGASDFTKSKNQPYGTIILIVQLLMASLKFWPTTAEMTSQLFEAHSPFRFSTH